MLSVATKDIEHNINSHGRGMSRDRASNIFLPLSNLKPRTPSGYQSLDPAPVLCYIILEL